MRAGAATWARSRDRRRGGGKVSNFFKRRFADFKSFLLPVLKKHGKKVRDASLQYAIDNRKDLIDSYKSKGISGLKNKLMTDIGPTFSKVVDNVTRGSGSYSTTNDLLQQSRDHLQKHVTMVPTSGRVWLDKNITKNPQQFPWFETMPVQSFVDTAVSNCHAGLSPSEKEKFRNDCIDHDIQELRGGIFPFLIPILAALGAIGAKAAAVGAVAAPIVAKAALTTGASYLAKKAAEKVIESARGSGAFYSPAGIGYDRGGSRKTSSFAFGKRHTTTYPRRLEVRESSKSKPKVIYVSQEMFDNIIN